MSVGKTAAIYGGTAFYSIGSMALIYSMLTFVGDAIDHVEYSQGIRVEGLTAAVVDFAEMFSKGIGQALFNLGLMISKYATPEVVGSFVNEKDSEILALRRPARRGHGMDQLLLSGREHAHGRAVLHIVRLLLQDRAGYAHRAADAGGE